jgi:hypothetical protein
MARTISGSISVGVSLASGDNPVSVTGTINTGTGSYALYGPSGTAWNVTNSGVITMGAANANG